MGLGFNPDECNSGNVDPDNMYIVQVLQNMLVCAKTHCCVRQRCL